MMLPYTTANYVAAAVAAAASRATVIVGFIASFLLQLARVTEAGRGVGEDATHLYGVKDTGFKPVIAFKDAFDQAHTGYAGQIQQAFVKGVIEPVGDWYRAVSRRHTCRWAVLGRVGLGWADGRDCWT